LRLANANKELEKALKPKTAEERLKRERFQQDCTQRERLWAEQVRQQKLKQDEKFARRVAR